MRTSRKHNNLGSRLKRFGTFLKALWRNPRSIGAFLPSSPYLAKEMARYVRPKTNDIVIELGPGTGVVTQALLKKTRHPHQLVAIEYSPSFARALKERFPEIVIIEGNALHLQDLLKPYQGRVAYIISSLPLRTLPLSTSRTILEQIEKTLKPKGLYIQFTYGYHYEIFDKLSTFKHYRSERVWLNLPPARVDVWKAP